jgi:hypothetical protein
MLVPTFADRWRHVVSVTYPYDRIPDFLDRNYLCIHVENGIILYINLLIYSNEYTCSVKVYSFVSVVEVLFQFITSVDGAVCCLVQVWFKIKLIQALNYLSLHGYKTKLNSMV